jgi:hypothetical protein
LWKEIEDGLKIERKDKVRIEMINYGVNYIAVIAQKVGKFLKEKFPTCPKKDHSTKGFDMYVIIHRYRNLINHP